MEARLGIGRVGAFRLGDYSPTVLLTIDGIERGLRVEGLSIRDTLGTPNVATVRVSGFEPHEGEVIRIGLGALDPNHQRFAGHILKKSRIYEADNVANVAYDLSCISWEWRLNRRKVNARFTSDSATNIATSLLASYAPEFTTVHVVAGLPELDVITFTNEHLTDALDRLTARIGGEWYVDEGKDLHLFLSETLTATTIDDTHRDASHIRWDRELSGVRTRVTVEGAGVTATAPALVGDTALAVDDLHWYETTGGIVVSGPQRVTYTGVVAGGGGALVGTTVTPTNGPAATGRATTGLSAGDYRYKTSFITAAGETLPSPASAVLTLGGAVAPPVSAPSAIKAIGGSLSAGAYQWKYSYLTAGGETLASSASASVTMDDVAAPTTISTISDGGNPGGTTATALDYDATYRYKYTFYDSVLGETFPSPASNVFTSQPVGYYNGGYGPQIFLTVSGAQSPPAGFVRRWYRTEGNGSTYLLRGLFTPAAGFNGYWIDSDADATLGAAAPSSSTAIYRSASVNVVASSDALVTNIRVYRTAAGGSVFKKVADIANTTTIYTDTLADASLGSTELGAATATYNAADLAGIAIGPTGTTQRKVYRTPANGATYGLLTTIGNNTTTTYTDTTADGSLGAAPPVTDTSGLVQQTGQVSAGSSTLLVTSTAPFRAAGGSAFIGTLAIRYTGITGSSLTGIPALGQDGALGTTVNYGVEVIAAPMLIGIPASGAGSILYPIATGDPVNLLIIEDDLAAQAALAELLTADGEPVADGVIEDYIQDRRLSSTEARNRALARLALVKNPLVTVTYETRDRHTRSGRDVTFNSTLLGLSATFRIQSVTYDHFSGNPHTWPPRHVVASSRRVSFEALLRLYRGGVLG